MFKDPCDTLTDPPQKRKKKRVHNKPHTKTVRCKIAKKTSFDVFFLRHPWINRKRSMGHFLFSPVSDFKKTRESQRRERAQRKKMYRAKQTARKEVTPRSSAFQFSARNDFSASASSHHSYEKKQTARKSIGPKKFPREETICHSRAYSEKPPSFDCDAYLQPTIVEPPPTKKRKREAPTTKQAAPKKPTPFEFNPGFYSLQKQLLLLS